MKFLLTAALFAFTATATQAAIAVTNIALPPVGGGWSLNATQSVSCSFTVGSGAPQWNFESADLNIYNGLPGSITITVELHADNGGNVGATIVGLNLTSAPAGQNSVNFTSPSPVLFDAGATYWLTATSADTNGSVGWTYANPNDGSETGEPGWSIRDNVGASFDGGSSWSDFAGTSPALFTINASAVPEPTTAVLALALLGTTLRRRRP